MPQLVPALDQNAVKLFWEDMPGGVLADEDRDTASAIAGASPFLRQLLIRESAFAARVLREPPQPLLDGIIASLRLAVAETDQALFMRALRKAKGRAALLIACADLTGHWNVEQVTEALTCHADATLQAAIDWLLLDAARAGRIRLGDDANPSAGCGYVALAMGKQGAYELNYSSDIDIIVLYDFASVILKEGAEPSTFFVRLTKRLVSLMQDVTEDGYAFRTDLRDHRV